MFELWLKADTAPCFCWCFSLHPSHTPLQCEMDPHQRVLFSFTHTDTNMMSCSYRESSGKHWGRNVFSVWINCCLHTHYMTNSSTACVCVGLYPSCLSAHEENNVCLCVCVFVDSAQTGCCLFFFSFYLSGGSESVLLIYSRLFLQMF